jgi:hypothetical protein
VLDLSRIDSLHLEEIDKESAVFIHGLCAVRGKTPVRRQRRLDRIEPIKAELRIGVADIECKQHV